MAQDSQIALIDALATRFTEHPHRHVGIKWSAVAVRLRDHPRALAAVLAMEASGGEPDVVGGMPGLPRGKIAFCDCSIESPSARRSLCYDDEALASRRQAKPKASACGMADAMKVQLLTEAQYQHLQSVGEFDRKTSSWIVTPDDVRARGGAFFGDRRFGRVFIYHNGAESYYAVRDWRGVVLV